VIISVVQCQQKAQKLVWKNDEHSRKPTVAPTELPKKLLSVVQPWWAELPGKLLFEVPREAADGELSEPE
jgi:hypothetical protein